MSKFTNFSKTRPGNSWKALISAITITLIVSSCARPPSTTVGEGADPFQVDKDVVFRTTYYFRVFDYCELKSSQGVGNAVVPLTDSLYRFRMTGKSKSFFSDVKFESGTLKAWEIDPFGVKVEFDKESKRYRVIPRHEVESDAQRVATLKNLNEAQSALFAVRKEFLDIFQDQINNNNESAKKILETIDNAIINGIKSLNFGNQANSSDYKLELLRLALKVVIKQISEVDESLKAEMQKLIPLVDEPFSANDIDAIRINEPDYVKRAVDVLINKSDELNGVQISSNAQLSLSNEEFYKPTENIINSLVSSPAYSGPPIPCPENAPVRRGFQVLGPEGWRTFDQDERLILAMSSSVQPLVSTLKKLSSRTFKAHDKRDAKLFPIALELKVVSEARHKLISEKNKPDPDPKELANTICKILIEDEEQSKDLCGDDDSN